MRKTFILMLFLGACFIGSQAQGYKVGDKASDFHLKNIDGNMLSLSDFEEAKGFVIIFTCNHCPYAVAYEDRIIELDKKYKSKGYPVIAINPNDPEIVPADSFTNMQKRAKDKGFTFPYLFDETQEVYRKYGATRTPHVFVLRKKSDNLIVEYIGTIDNNYKDASKANEHFLKDAIEALLKGKKPEPNFTKAIGCSIKSK
ncbi:MAG: thioredoxin family protein [Marinifilaceae bacterium]